MNRFIRECPVLLSLDKLGSQTCVSFAVSSDRAYVERIRTVDLDDGGREVVFYVRDRGDWGAAGFNIGIEFVLRTGRVTLIPALGGRLLGLVFSRCGRWSWFLFARRTGDQPSRSFFVPSPGRTDAETPAPPVPSASNAPAGALRAGAGQDRGSMPDTDDGL